MSFSPIIKGMTKLDHNIFGTSLVIFLLLQRVRKPQNETNKQIHGRGRGLTSLLGPVNELENYHSYQTSRAG